MLKSIFVLVGFFTVVGCSAPEPPGRQFLVFIDQSGSVDPSQRQQWEQQIAFLAGQFRCRDSAAVFGVHDTTELAAWTFMDTTGSDEDQGLTAALRCREDLPRLQEGFLSSTNQMLTSAKHANSTDLLGMFPVVEKSGIGKGPVIVVVFSDAIQSSSDLNLEKVVLDPQDFAPVIERLAFTRFWHPETLSRARFLFVLNSVGMGQAPGRNPRPVLEQFWGSAIQALGGELITFAPNITVHDIERAEQ